MPKRIDLEAVVTATLQDVWQAWTTNEGMQAFLAPDSNIELRLGGPYEIFFLPDAAAGQRGSDGCRILSYLPREMLSFSWNAPPQFAHARQHPTWVVVRFKELADEEVKVSLSHLGWIERKKEFPDHVEEWEAVQQYFARAWRTVLERLQAYFASLS